MLMRVLAAFVALILMAVSTEAKRVALVIGQSAYPSNNFLVLDNPASDARSMATLLAGHGFEVLACDGITPGCFNLGVAPFLKAIDELKSRATGADMALVFFAGHGSATPEGNMLAPTA